MIKFNCKNGSFEIQSSSETRFYNDAGNKIKNLTILASSQNINIDKIEEILVDSGAVDSFSIVNELNGCIIGEYSGYKLTNITKSTQGNSAFIQINYTKED